MEHGASRCILLSGEAGIGKSALAHDVMDRLGDDGWFCHEIEGALTRRNRPLYPWSKFFTALLFGDEKPSLPLLKGIIERYCPEFYRDVSLFAEFFRVPDVDAEAHPIDDKETKNRLLLHHLSRLLIALCREQRTLIILDNIHWFDSLSRELVKTLLTMLEHDSILLLGCVRHDENVLDLRGFPTLSEITVTGLPRDATGELCSVLLDAAVNPDLTERVFGQTGGNPLFIRHLLDHMKAQDALFKLPDSWMIRKDYRISGTLAHDDLIISAIERLSAPMKEHLMFTTCAGVSGDSALIGKAMGHSFQQQAWTSLMQTDFFQSSSVNEYQFAQNLVQDVIYHAIPLKLRKKIHRRLGTVYETIPQAEQVNLLGNMASHFHLAGHAPKAYHHASRAGFHFYEQVLFHEAATYLEIAWTLARRRRNEEKWEIGLTYVESLLKVGRTTECRPVVDTIIRSSQRKGRTDVVAKAHVLSFKVQLLTGDYSFIPRALRMLDRMPLSPPHLRYELMYYIGDGSSRIGQLAQAELTLNNLITAGSDSRCKDIKVITVIAACGILASIMKFREQWDLGIDTIDRGLALAQQNRLSFHELRLMTEKASILLASGHPDAAIAAYTSLLPVCEETGDMYVWGAVLLNLGQLYIDMQRLKLAKETLESAVTITHRSGTLVAEAVAHNCLGIVHFEQEEFEPALESYERARILLEQARDMKQLMDVYYNCAEVCLALHKTDQARLWADKGCELAKHMELQESIDAFKELRNEIPGESPAT